MAFSRKAYKYSVMEMSITIQMRRIGPQIFKEEKAIEKAGEREKTAQLFRAQTLSLSETAGGFTWKGSREIPKAIPQTCTAFLPFHITSIKNQRERRCQSSSVLTCIQRHKINLIFYKTPEAGRWRWSVSKWRWAGILSLHLPWPEADKYTSPVVSQAFIWPGL